MRDRDVRIAETHRDRDIQIANAMKEKEIQIEGAQRNETIGKAEAVRDTRVRTSEANAVSLVPSISSSSCLQKRKFNKKLYLSPIFFEEKFISLCVISKFHVNLHRRQLF